MALQAVTLRADKKARVRRQPADRQDERLSRFVELAVSG